jgi:hypothetical protein
MLITGSHTLTSDRAEQDVVFVPSHLRYVGTAEQQHRHTHIEQTDGQFSGNDRAALLKVDGYYGGGQIGLTILMILKLRCV